MTLSTQPVWATSKYILRIHNTSSLQNALSGPITETYKKSQGLSMPPTSVRCSHISRQTTLLQLQSCFSKFMPPSPEASASILQSCRIHQWTTILVRWQLVPYEEQPPPSSFLGRVRGKGGSGECKLQIWSRGKSDGISLKNCGIARATWTSAFCFHQTLTITDVTRLAHCWDIALLVIWGSIWEWTSITNVQGENLFKMLLIRWKTG